MPSKVIVNIDETGVYFDTPPTRILCERGAPSNTTTSQKHSARMTVVNLTLFNTKLGWIVMFGLRIYVP
ncbi:hypothetical protein F443_05141 [Phytophthora nicotianae P1569]|uniref:DDE-1 domain-containing protein n=1 Tax=Phytophthora nicotianae P1569 TaxID=1317065 RepID=V9FMB8_PHYNI|nr:hypothetical protein F443_05141 [Phytophthora nicotianae P1569]